MSDRSTYEVIAEELESGKPRRELWMKAMLNSNGNEDAARGLYIRMRTGELESQAKAEESRLAERRRIEAAEAQDTQRQLKAQRMSLRAKSRASTASTMALVVVGSLVVLVGVSVIAQGVFIGGLLTMLVGSIVLATAWFAWTKAREDRRILAEFDAETAHTF